MQNEELHKFLENLNGKKVVIKILTKSHSIVSNQFGKLDGAHEINNDSYSVTTKDGNIQIRPDEMDGKVTVVGKFLKFEAKEYELYIGPK